MAFITPLFSRAPRMACLSLALGMVVLSGCSGEKIQTDRRGIDKNLDKAPLGQKVFESQCAQCHMVGGTMPIDRLARTSLKLHTPDMFKTFLEDPPMGMPAFYESKLPKKEFDALYSYLKSTYVDTPEEDANRVHY